MKAEFLVNSHNYFLEKLLNTEPYYDISCQDATISPEKKIIQNKNTISTSNINKNDNFAHKYEENNNSPIKNASILKSNLQTKTSSEFDKNYLIKHSNV